MRLKSITVFAAVLHLFVFVRVATTGPQDDACRLPADLKRDVARQYPGRTLVSLSDLGDDDRKFFQEGHGNSCPGLVKVDFYGDGKPTFALALTTQSAAKGKTELVVAHQVEATWKTITLETVDGDAPVVWSEKPGEYKDVYGEKRVRATKPVIIFCRYEAWKILYAWTNNRAAKIWLMD
jgi:hypothetical protein